MYISMSEIKKLNTGSVTLDIALQGGYLSGRIIEISGSQSSGKSMLALHSVKQIQRQGGLAVYIDVDRKITDEYLTSINIIKDDVYFAHPRSLEETSNITDQLLVNPDVDLIVIDNVSNLVIDKNINSGIMEYDYKAQNKAFRNYVYKLSHTSKTNDTTIIFVNQYRTHFETDTSGHKRSKGLRPMYSDLFKNFASTRVSLRRASTIKSDIINVGDRIEATIHKSPNIIRYENPFVFDTQYKTGIDNIKEIVDIAIGLDVMELSGSWYRMGDTIIGQGIDDTRKNLNNKGSLFDNLLDNIIEKENDYEFIRQYKSTER